MSVYSGIASSALSLITKKGQAITIVRRSETMDPITHQKTVSETRGTFRAVALPPGKDAEFTIGGLIGRNVVELHIAMKGASFVPKPGDALTVGSLPYRIIWTANYDPAGDGAIYMKAYAE